MIPVAFGHGSRRWPLAQSSPLWARADALTSVPHPRVRWQEMLFGEDGRADAAGTTFEPGNHAKDRARRKRRWAQALERSLGWGEEEVVED